MLPYFSKCYPPMFRVRRNSELVSKKVTLVYLYVLIILIPYVKAFLYILRFLIPLFKGAVMI